ncbi:MAG: GNAT family N-acetyltransferase [Synergistaceae bacterium]|jgi:GNAT superfamily N-acetyltransferase|nr:GNAT family N-acetyltransferase [Synergistaceae bacterium]
MKNIDIRPAVVKDVPLILDFIRELAAYEKLLDQVVATEPLLHEWLFERKKAEAIIAELDGEPAGYALFFHNFSTFLGRAGIYLEDLYVRPAARRRGIGRRLLENAASVARERGCGRLEWSCLDWNKPGIAFYLSLGAQPMDDWTVYRMTGEAIDRLAAGGKSGSSGGASGTI